jgi:hypothetical protein
MSPREARQIRRDLQEVNPGSAREKALTRELEDAYKRGEGTLTGSSRVLEEMDERMTHATDFVRKLMRGEIPMGDRPSAADLKEKYKGKLSGQFEYLLKVLKGEKKPDDDE